MRVLLTWVFQKIIFKHWRRQLWGTGARAPSTSKCLIFSGHFRAAQTLTLDSMTWLPPQKECTEYRPYSFVTVYCMNFINICARHPKIIFSYSLVPLLAPNPVETTVLKHLSSKTKLVFIKLDYTAQPYLSFFVYSVSVSKADYSLYCIGVTATVA